jgi:hypothetical protein
MHGAHTTTSTLNAGASLKGINVPKPTYTISQIDNGFLVNIHNADGMYGMQTYAFPKFIELAAFLEARLDF